MPISVTAPGQTVLLADYNLSHTFSPIVKMILVTISVEMTLSRVDKAALQVLHFKKEEILSFSMKSTLISGMY